MKVTIKGKRGGTKTIEVRTIAQLEEAIRRVPYSYDRKHDQMMLLGSFIAEQLVEINQGRAIRRGNRQPSEWNRFFAAGMRAGKSTQEISAEWQARKVKRIS